MNGLTNYGRGVLNGERRGVGPMLLRAGLRTAAVPMAMGVRIRNALYDHRLKTIHKAAVPVISVGNLSMGGTGKTPCVEWVARHLAESGHRPVIISRGYGSDGGRNDEALVLEDNLPDVPHLQGADRIALAATAVEELEADVLVLDDGFQHRRLHRDLDIVLLDATRPLRSEWLFPGGMLREPASSLRRAHFLLLTRCDQATNLEEQIAWLKKKCPTTPVGTCTHAPQSWITLADQDVLLNAYVGRPVAAFCGLGNPTAFQKTLQSLGHTPCEFRTFPDHHNYTRADVEELTRWAATLPPDAVILTTQKDFVKLRIADLAGRQVATLRIGLQFQSGEEELSQQLHTRMPMLTAEDES